MICIFSLYFVSPFMIGNFFLPLLNYDIFYKSFLLLFSYDLQTRITELETQKEKTHEDTKEVNEKSSKLAEEMKDKNKSLKEVEK